MEPDGAYATFDSAWFNEQLATMRAAMHRESGSFVRQQSARLIKKFSFEAPIAAGNYAARGRLRAGFWPAATALNITNIYTPYPNKGEGSGLNDTYNERQPSFTIVNSVPYVGTVPGEGTNWWYVAANEIIARMESDFAEYWQRVHASTGF